MALHAIGSIYTCLCCWVVLQQYFNRTWMQEALLSMQEMPAACSLILLMTAVASAKFLRPTVMDYWNVVASGSLQEIFEEGYWWSVVTPVLVHSDLRHFLYNMFFFFAYSRLLESVLGSLQLVALFFGSHVVGFLFRLLINRIQKPDMYYFLGGCGCSRCLCFLTVRVASRPRSRSFTAPPTFSRSSCSACIPTAPSPPSAALLCAWF